MRLIAFAAALTISAMPVAAQDWNRTSTVTEGGHRIGNPEAENQLITFVSYTCPHCADFEQQGDAPLRLVYIPSGKISYEIRHFIRNSVDLTAALLTECGDDGKFFGNHRAILSAQENWLAKANRLTPAQRQRWNAGELPTRLRAIASDLDFYTLLEERGYTRAGLDNCLSDEAKAEAIISQVAADDARWDIPGTPSFVLNGRLLAAVHSWPQLQQALDARTK